MHKMNILLSGMMRSGTTLLQHSLNAHPKISLSYQENINKYIKAKLVFLNKKGIDNYHKLWHYNPSRDYSFAEFDNWINENISWFKSLFLIEGANQPISKGIQYCGSKEVLVEEFYPALIKNNIKCINIIRDPRDVITSMSFGEGGYWTGKPRPVLFDIRNWRKSVHISYYLRNNPNFLTVRFEDLLINPEEELKNIYRFLGVLDLPLSEVKQALVTESWQGNSSFKKMEVFDKKALAGYKKHLPKRVREYIEAICEPEMKYLGYARDGLSICSVDLINKYADPYSITRKEFNQDYSSTNYLDYEKNRLKKDIEMINREIFS